MRVVAFRHVPFEGLGLIQAALEERDISVDFPDLFHEGAAVPDMSTAAGIIVMGGPMSANDDLPYLRQELEVIRQAVERRQPVLGVCLGAQLIAKALGARVYPNPVKEIGWFDVHLTEAGRQDPVLAGLDGREAWRNVRPAPRRRLAGVFRSVPPPGVPGRLQCLWPAVSPRSDS